MNSLTIYRWGYPLILGIMDVHLSPPVLFVVLLQLYFRHHGIDASAFLRMDWIVDKSQKSKTSIVRTYLCQNAPGEICITKPYERYKQRSETPGERPKLLA